MGLEPLLTVSEAATFLRVSPWTVRELVRTGRLPVYRVGGQLRFDPAEVRHWLKEGRLVPAATRPGRRVGEGRKRQRSELRLAEQSNV